MKTKWFFFWLLLCMPFFSIGQVTDIRSNLNNGLKDLVVYDGYVYYTSFIAKKLYRISLTTNANPEIVASFPQSPIHLLLDGNTIFIATEQNYKIYKLNLSNTPSNLEIVANIGGPMLKIDNFLYVGQYTQSKISKINLTDGAITDVLTGYKPNYFACYNNEIYFTSNTTNTLYKFNPNADTPIAIPLLQNMDYAAGICIYNDKLVVCESMSNKISTYTLTDFRLFSSYFLGANSWPNGVFYFQNEMYFTQTVAGKISYINIATLSENSFEIAAKKCSIYPNPTTAQIHIDTDENFEFYEIYSINSQLLERKNWNHEQINLEHLSAGVYFLKLGTFMYKIVKE